MKKQAVFCTYFDKNYLPKGLSMHQSFITYHPWAKLYILCMDNYTKQTIDKLKLKGVKTIALKEFEDSKLLAVKKDRTLIEYYWTCTPSLPLYIFEVDKEAQTVVYLDADIYFYSSCLPVFTELGQQSIYTVEHRFPRSQESLINLSGRFNVAFQVFRRDQEALSCLKRWRRQCLKWCYFKVEDGKMGDQLYLNEWPNLYKGLVISANLGINTAPWNISQYKVSNKGHNVYINNDQLVFYHFHQFEILSENKFKYISGYKLSEKVFKLIYDPYAKQIQKQISRIKKLDPKFKIVTPRQPLKNVLRHWVSNCLCLKYLKKAIKLINQARVNQTQ